MRIETLEQDNQPNADFYSDVDIGFCIIQVDYDAQNRRADYRFLEVNDAFEDHTGLRDAAGQWMRNLAPEHEQFWFDRYGEIARTGRPARFTYTAQALGGRHFEVYAYRVGAPGEGRVAVLFADISARKRQDLLRAALFDLTDGLAQHDGSIAGLTDAACQVLGAALDVQLVGYGLVDPDAETIRVERDWTTGGARSLAGTLHFRDFGSYIDDLKRGDTVIVADARTDARTRANAGALEAHSARAFVNTPIFERGRFVALQYVSTGQPRLWSEDELRFIREVGTRLRTATERHRAEQALKDQAASLARTVEDRTVERDRARADAERVQNALAAGAIIGTWFWDLPTDQFTVDEAFATAFGLDPALGREGIPLAQIVATVHPDDQAGLAEAIDEAITRGGRYAHQYRVRGRDGRYHWLEANGHVEHARDGTPLRFPGVLIDVAARRLDAALAHLSDRLRTLRTSQAMVLAVAEIVGTALGLSRVAYGDVDAAGQRIVISHDWRLEGQASAAGDHDFADFGIYADALRRGEDVAIDDVSVDPRTAGQAANFRPLDIAALANLPLMDQGRLKVVFCLHANHPHAWTGDELAFARRAMDRAEVEIARHKAESQAEENGERLRLVIEGASDHAILTTDPAGLTTSWSAGAQAIFGWTSEEITGRPVAVIFTPEDRAAGIPEREMANARQKGSADDERWHVTKTGTRVFMNGSVHPLPPDAQGRERGFIKIARDETERRRSDAALKELNATLEQRIAERTADRNALWLLSSDIMLRCTFAGVMTAVNPAWTEVLGWREDELIGRSLFDLIHPDDMAHTIEGARALSEGEGHTRFDNRYRHKNGSYRWISWSTISAEGLINAVGRDFTAEQEKAHTLELTAEALRQSQKMEAVGQLTGGVAHDFNNLLTIIRSSVDFLRRPELPEARKGRYLDAVSETVDRAAKLTGQLLAFARRQALQPEVFDVGARLRGVGDMLDTVTGARVHMTVEVPEKPCFIRADISQFETALVNMVVNARDAMDGEGRLLLRLVCGARLPPIRGHAGSASPFAAVSVTDTGSGIAPEQIGRIFEPFFTTKEVGKGTGLGLSQVFGFAKQSGGDVDVESVVGRGTTFTLYLPEETAPARIEEDGGETALPVIASGQRVLVVEDNMEVGRFCTQILEDLGYRTEWVGNAETALDKLGTTGGGFDVVFSDVVMPGMGGVALAEALRERLPRLPVVLSSGYSHVLAREADHGFELLHKPYSAEQLARVLQRVIARTYGDRLQNGDGLPT